MKEFIKKKRYFVLFCAIAFALMLRMSYFGFEYFPQLDDYIQYYNFATADDYMQLIRDEGLFASRPLATLCDLYIWAQLPLYLSELIISLLYAGSAVLFTKVFERHFNTGLFFGVFYALLPLGYEGTYWISASARVVPGLFFTALTLWLFDTLCESRRLWLLLPFLLSALMSYGYYEQLLVLSVALVFMLAIVRFIKKDKISLTAFSIFLPLAFYFLFTRHFASGSSAITNRMETIMPVSPYYFKVFLPEVLTQIKNAFIVGGGATLVKGFVRGISIIFNQGVFSALLIPVSAALFFVTARAEKLKNEESYIKKGAICLVFALLAILAPITPFLIIANPWFCMRNTVASFVGIALLGDLICRGLIGFVKSDGAKSAVLAWSIAAVTAVFLVSGVSELYDYKRTTEADVAVMNAIVEADESYDLVGNVGIFELETSMLDEQNFEFHEHITGVTNSDWSLYGALVHHTGGELDFTPCPLATRGSFFWVGWNRSIKDLSRFDTVLRYDRQSGAMIKLEVEAGENEYIVYNPDGSCYARVWHENEPYGYIEFFNS